MIKTLRESKAKLSELVELASQGEDTLITVRGTIKARLTSAVTEKKSNMKTWIEELNQLDKYTITNTLSTEQILEESRKDHL